MSQQDRRYRINFLCNDLEVTPKPSGPKPEEPPPDTAPAPKRGGPTISNRRCPMESCRKLFSTRPRLRDHFKHHAAERAFICPYPDCIRGYETKASLEYHQYAHYDTAHRGFMCEVCGAKFHTFADRMAHIASCPGTQA
jgi:hypothetical protein